MKNCAIVISLIWISVVIAVDVPFVAHGKL